MRQILFSFLLMYKVPDHEISSQGFFYIIQAQLAIAQYVNNVHTWRSAQPSVNFTKMLENFQFLLIFKKEFRRHVK
jgi:hypothetical protein